MNPAYRHARFRAEMPHGGLPESFCIVTACNPEGRTIPDKENEERTRKLGQQLAKHGYDHFPVTGYDAQSPHEEAGFGIVCDLGKVVAADMPLDGISQRVDHAYAAPPQTTTSKPAMNFLM